MADNSGRGRLHAPGYGQSAEWRKGSRKRGRDALLFAGLAAFVAAMGQPQVAIWFAGVAAVAGVIWFVMRDESTVAKQRKKTGLLLPFVLAFLMIALGVLAIAAALTADYGDAYTTGELLHDLGVLR